MKNLLVFCFCCYLSASVFAQKDTLPSRLKLSGDFRFRVEQDWDSRKSDGTYRDDRTRFRYRLRYGAVYRYNSWASFGASIRTGQQNKQQDPQLTLGSGTGEFSTLPIGLDKAYFLADYSFFSGWIGKNKFPFRKQHELFWSDNVCPEGIHLSIKHRFKTNLIESLSLNAGHFIVNTSGKSLDADRYFQGIQLISKHWNNRITFFPSFFYFSNMPDIPDGFGTYNIDYKIVNLGLTLILHQKLGLKAEFDWYNNIEDMNKYPAGVSTTLKKQKEGLVAGLELGENKQKGDWCFKLVYANLERYAAVDFLAQNDWARWDYSGIGSPDGRLTNFHGLEVFAGYSISEKFNLKMRYFLVEQLVSYGQTRETNSRIRLDLNIGF